MPLIRYRSSVQGKKTSKLAELFWFKADGGSLDRDSPTGPPASRHDAGLGFREHTNEGQWGARSSLRQVHLAQVVDANAPTAKDVNLCLNSGLVVTPARPHLAFRPHQHQPLAFPASSPASSPFQAACNCTPESGLWDAPHDLPACPLGHRQPRYICHSPRGCNKCPFVFISLEMTRLLQGDFVTVAKSPSKIILLRGRVGGTPLRL